MIRHQEKGPFAITMWDSSWIRRRFAGGGFEDWDVALDELVERGYNAVRIDVFPHMIAHGPDGSEALRFRDLPGQSPHPYGFAGWGSPWTIYIEPRRSVVEFIRKCQARQVYVALSTWLKPTEERRNEKLEGVADLVRIWDETLTFLQENGCLDNVLYTDILNEYPPGSCNLWLYNSVSLLSQPEQPGKRVNERQKRFYRTYINEVILKLKEKWPDMPFCASSTFGWLSEYDLDMDYSAYDLFDIHIWVQGQIAAGTGYYEHICKHGDPDHLYTTVVAPTGLSGYVKTLRTIPGDIHYEDSYAKLRQNWLADLAGHEAWLADKIRIAAELGQRWRIPVGNTEGWGTVFWVEHPMLEWDIIKEAGQMAARLANQADFAFNCSSNFCHPQFIRLWRDVAHHRAVTAQIKARNG
jgi:hypothetical protein